MQGLLDRIQDLLDSLFTSFFFLDNFKVYLAKKMWGASRRRRFYDKLAELLASGARLTDALKSLQRRTVRHKSGFVPHYYALNEVLSAIRRGDMLSDAMKEWAPQHEINLIKAGEEAGDLPNTLEFTSKIIEGRGRLQAAFVGALAYPFVLLLGAIGLLFLIGYSLIPRMAQIGDPTSWEGSAYAMYQLSQFLQSYWALTVPVVAGAIAIFIFITLKKPILPKKVRVVLDRYPPWSFYRLFVGSGFLLNLSSLLNAGVSQQEALRLIRDDAPPYMRDRVDGILRQMRGGADNIGEAMYRCGYEFPDREVIEDLMTYADLPNFTERLEEMGTEWMEKGISRVEGQAQYLNWLMLVIIGVGITWTAYAVYTIQQSFLSKMGV